MHLISALASGMVGGGSGYARLFLRGTSTRATYYTDFEGLSPVTSGADIALDGNGRTIAYVNTLVTVSVYSSAGVLLGTFTDGAASTAVEVRNAGFTGVNYQTGASAAGDPTNLDAVLSKWSTSAAAVDFNVEMQDVDMTLKSAFWKTRKMFNVKDPTYGATGNGLTDDYASINSAITALVAAGGGVLYFPRGTYLISSPLSITLVPFLILGDGAGVTILAQFTGGGDLMTANNANILTIMDMGFLTSVTASETITVIDSKLSIRNCKFSSSVTAAMIYLSDSTATVKIDSCLFLMTSTLARAVFSNVVGGSDVFCEISDSTFNAGSAGAYAIGANNGIVDGCGIGLSDCRFVVPAAALSGSCFQVNPASGSGLTGYATGCIFEMNNGVMYCISAASDTCTGYFHESGNSFQDMDSAVQPLYFELSGDETGIILDSKASLVQAKTNTAAAVALDAQSYGRFAIRQTSGAALSISLSYTGPPGDEIDITVYNNRGGALAVTLDTNFFYGTWSATSIADTRKRSLRFVLTNFNGTYRYMQTGADAGDLG